MNILADEQKRLYEVGISDEERELRTKKFNELYFKLRNKDENSILGRMSLKTRKKLHKLILLVYIIKNRLGGFRYEIIKDERIKTNRPTIFAVTHVGKFDIEVVSEAIKSHYYLLSGDYEHLQGIADASFLAMNGVIYFNEKVKSDRAEVSKKMIHHLKSGGNLMYFSEGTWNLSPNLPMLPCYWGIVDVARKGEAIVIPVAAEQYGKHFKINIGKNIDMSHYGEGTKGKAEAIRDLRDILSTLKWEIWESEPIVNRKNMIESEWDKYIEARFKEWPYFNLEYINGMTFKPKDVIESEEAFKHLEYLIPCKENSFLYRRR